MAIYRYKAVSADGDMIQGQMEAASREEVIGRLQDQGNTPIEAREAQAGESTGGLGFFRRNEMSNAEIISFTQQLSTLMGAGQPLDRALQILVELPDDERARKLIDRVRESVRGGAPLSTALEQQHGVFTRLYVNMVRAGEVSGSLHTTLKRLAEYMERSKAVRDTVVSALIYPVILLVMILAALVLLLIYVVPQFLPLFQDFGAELPLITRFVLGLGDFLAGYWWLLLAVVVGAVYFIRNTLRDPQRRLQFDEWLMTNKTIGGLIGRIETARLSRTLGTLLTNGVPLLMAMSIGRNVVGNHALVQAVDSAANDVKQGAGLSYGLGKGKLFPRLALQMIAVGEESGDLDGMLLKIADTFDIEVKNAVDRLLAALVPALTIVMALLVAFIMMALLLPILDLTNQI